MNRLLWHTLPNHGRLDLLVLAVASAFLLGAARPAWAANEGSQSLHDIDVIPNELKLFQQMPLVITAARKPQRITEASSTIDVITAEDIRRSGALTLAELLERLPGIYTPTAHNALDMLWIRGVGGRYNDKALLLIDGIPYRTLYFSNFPINEQIPLGDIKKIEIIRGPGSALYGTNAFTGVINILTKDVIDMKANEVAATYGTWDTGSIHMYGGREFEDGEISGFARYLDSSGHHGRHDDEGNPSSERRGANNKAYKLKLRLGHFDFNLRYSKFALDEFTAVPDENEQGGISSREHLLSQLSFGRDITNNLSLRITAYYNHFDNERMSVSRRPDFSVITTNETQRDGRVAGLDVLTTMTFSERHSLLFGLNVEYEYLDRSWSKSTDVETGEVRLSEWASASGGDKPESIDNTNYGVYLEDELRLGSTIILTSGLRFDAFQASGSRVSPRISLVHIPDPKTAIKLRYGEAFRAPTYQELYKQTDDSEGEGNRNLSPQTIRTAEFEVSRFIGKRQRLNTTIFYTTFDKFIKIIGDGDFENLENREFYGLELGVSGSVTKDLSYFANLSHTETKESNGRDVDAVPRNMANIGFTYSGLSWIEISPHIRMVGKRNRPANYQGDVPQANRRDLLGAYALMNLNLRFTKLPGTMTASLSVRNLFDTTYHTSGEIVEDYDIHQPGRRIMFTVGMEF